MASPAEETDTRGGSRVDTSQYAACLLCSRCDKKGNLGEKGFSFEVRYTVSEKHACKRG